MIKFLEEIFHHVFMAVIGFVSLLIAIVLFQNDQYVEAMFPALFVLYVAASLSMKIVDFLDRKDK